MSGKFGSVADRTADLLTLMDTHRWGIIKTGRVQYVAEHSFAVAILAWALVDELNYTGDQSAFMLQILQWALVHDAPEGVTCDIDGKFKREFPEFDDALKAAEQQAYPWYRAVVEQIDHRVKAVVKVADHIESCSWIKTWGVGARADNVRFELMDIIHNYDIPMLARTLDLELDRADRVVRNLMHRQMSESNTYQMRPRRET